uniref:TF-B3 domain-containing protein n=2 Tax=Opuntia streptacantha TaxID=393608 RepID=A0A7C8Z1H0_OPUST
MVVAAVNYEECRRQRLEENKKRMEQLNLHKLAQSLKATSSPSKSPKSSPVKKLKGRSDQLPLTPVRRSSRMADKPVPNYKEYGLDILVGGRRTYYKRRDLLNRVYASEKDRVYAIERAEELEATLGSNPCCIKPMLQSHVTGGFWLSLPLPFCKDNLPDHDEWVTLVDEDGGEWQTKYLAAKNGLSGGWRGFAIDHELVDGDCLIFQLVKPNTLKVHIIRVNSSEEDELADEDGQEEKNDAAEDVKVKGKKNDNKRKSR